MKIGLAGIPGAGKTDLANALKTYFESNNETCLVIDDYVDPLQKRINLALGFEAAYVGNIHIALERAGLERSADEEYDHIITCGTMFENASYAAQSLETDYQFISNDVEKQDFIIRSEATMRVFGCFYIDLVKYDYLFHLTPLSAANSQNVENLERNLQSAFESFNLIKYTPLLLNGVNNEEIVKNRLDKVIEVIYANSDEESNVQTEESNGSGVRPSEQASEE